MSTLSVDVQVNPFNRNQTLFVGNLYKGLPVMAGKGPFVAEYLEALYNTQAKALVDYRRVCALRFDLRFPRSSLAGNEETSNAVVSRFIESIKAKIDHNRQTARDRNPYAHQSKVRYLWAREVGVDGRVHYHVALFLNGEAYFTLGNFQSDQPNLAKRIASAWTSALGIDEGLSTGLVHFPDNPVYRVDRLEASSISNFFYRASYLCKLNTKSYGYGHHGFGYSRG